MTPFDEGRAAFQEGVLETDNPYTKGTDAHAQWLEGYAFDTSHELDECAVEDD